MNNINVPLWPGSASFFPGDTPFGYYDDEEQFQTDVENVAVWAARRLGYPIVEVELQDLHFFSAFEEAINEYSKQVNTFQGRDNILNLLGLPTGSSNLSNLYVENSSNGIIKLSKHYGTDVGSGGNLTYYTGSIQVQESRQVYDIKSYSGVTLESGNISTDDITVRRFFYEPTPAVMQYIDPSSGFSLQALQEQFGWGSMSIPSNTLVMPLYADVLKMQQIEFNNELRRNTYSCQLINNRLRIFPIPTTDYTLHFHYTLNSDSSPFDSSGNPRSASVGKITDYSNIPYGIIPYTHINHIGKQWIRRFALALCKEMLGYIRGKYSTVPIPDGEVTLNSADLIAAAQQEQTDLITELKETLDQFSRQSQLERKGAEADTMLSQLTKYPLKIYVK